MTETLICGPRNVADASPVKCFLPHLLSLQELTVDGRRRRCSPSLQPERDFGSAERLVTAQAPYLQRRRCLELLKVDSMRHSETDEWEAERAEWVYVRLGEKRMRGRIVSIGVTGLLVAAVIVVALVLR